MIARLLLCLLVARCALPTMADACDEYYLQGVSQTVLDECGEYETPGVGLGLANEFSLRLTNDETVALETSHGNGECPSTYMEIYSEYPSSGCELVAWSWPDVFGCSHLTESLPPGDYTILVWSYPGISSYTLEYFTSSCSVCGNGIAEVEQCDGSDLDECVVGPCTASCTCPFIPLGCGDSVFQPEDEEECDDGNRVGGDGCDENCLREAETLQRCGSYEQRGVGSIDRYVFSIAADAVVRLEMAGAGGECSSDTVITMRDVQGNQVAYDEDSGVGLCSRVLAPLSGGTYAATVEVSTRSGNLVLRPLRPYVLDYYTSDCSTCGNGVVEAEECDDGNLVNGDGCGSNCQLEIPILEPCSSYEQPGLEAGDVEEFAFMLSSRDTVRLETTDGDSGCSGEGDTILSVYDAEGSLVAEGTDSGVGLLVELPAGEYAVTASPFPPPFGPAAIDAHVLKYFTGKCSACGNGVVEAEECDDGNLINGDGCDSSCQPEILILEPGSSHEQPGMECGDLEEFAFTLSSPDTVRLATTNGDGGCPGDVDTYLSLIDAEGNLIAVDDDSGVGSCSQLVVDLPAGEYTLYVTGGTDAYVLEYFTRERSICGNGVLEVEECDDGNLVNGDGCDSSCQPEIRIPILEPCTSYASPGLNPFGRDDYTFTLNRPDRIRLETTDGKGGCPSEVFEGEFFPLDTWILVCDAECNLFAEDDDSGVGSCSQLVVELPAGEYAAYVYSKSLGFSAYVLEYFTGQCSTCGNGTLEAEECDDGNLVNGDGCDSDCKRRIPVVDTCGDYVAPGFLENGSNDFQLLLASRQLVRLETTGPSGRCPGDTILEVYDDLGELIASDDQSGAGPCSALTLELEAGSYGVVVRGFEGSGLGPCVLRYENESCSPCGNGILEFDEQCDDGNSFDGDGCDSMCLREPVRITGCGQSRAPAFGLGETGEFLIMPEVSGPIVFETTGFDGTCPGDTVLEIYDEASSTTLLAADNDSGDGLCSRVSVNLAAGTIYRVTVRELSGTALRSYVLRHSGETLCGNCGNGVVDEGEECDDEDPFFKAGERCGVLCARTPCGQPASDPSSSGVSAIDALYVLQNAVGLKPCDKAVCDVNGDGTVGATDALSTLRAAVGLGELSGCPE